MFLETEKSLYSYKETFALINIVNVMIFTIEYILRIYSFPKNKLKYAFRPLMLVDLIVLLPFYLSFFSVDLSFLRTLRVLRIFKLFRLSKFTQFDNIMMSILKEKKEELLYVAISLLILLFTLTPLVYFFESKAQPEVFSSMGAALWWSITTFTTVGYGDMYPITTPGRILTTIVSVLGIAFYAVPGSIFTSALLDKIKENKEKRK
jgi:voltage-gated potassium channel